ncbi:MAG: rhomboid family intramembrane serine protease [Arenimonas sp.]
MIWLLPWKEEDTAKHTPWAVYVLIFLNIVVFIAMWSESVDGATDWFDRFGLAPSNWQWYQFITTTFIHADIFHLVFNMLFLWLIGDSVEDAIGPIGFLLLYFLGGFAGELWYVSANPGLAIPTVGASGCIATIAGACAVMFFSQPVAVRVMFLVFTMTTIRLKAFWMLLLWFGMDVFMTFEGRGEMGATEVNFVAHGAGFAFGFAVGFVAIVHGVMRRYLSLSEGSDWFGYWPESLEKDIRRRRRPR